MSVQAACRTEQARARRTSILQTVHIPKAEDDALGVLRKKLGAEDPAHMLVFANNKATLEQVGTAAGQAFAGATMSGCTTAGQIGRSGYEDEDTIVIALPRAHFATHTVPISVDDISDGQNLIDSLVQQRIKLSTAHPEFPNGFAFLLVDGLSLREDILAAAIAPAMGAWQMFGGSSGDGTRFEETCLATQDGLEKTLALLTFVVTDCATHVFSLNHFTPTTRKMVVTSADTEKRIVKEINAEPAAREYARIVGRDPNQLDEFTFAANPVVVKLGDTHHVRSIQRVTENGELVFFAAIDEGMVLTIADADHIADHLRRELSAFRAQHGETEILACDCLLRRIEAEQSQSTHAVSQVLGRNRVVGFSTYGEQIGPLHVNHTMTGVLLAPPKGHGHGSD